LVVAATLAIPAGIAREIGVLERARVRHVGVLALSQRPPPPLRRAGPRTRGEKLALLALEERGAAGLRIRLARLGIADDDAGPPRLLLVVVEVLPRQAADRAEPVNRVERGLIEAQQSRIAGQQLRQVVDALGHQRAEPAEVVEAEVVPGHTALGQARSAGGA